MAPPCAVDGRLNSTTTQVRVLLLRLRGNVEGRGRDRAVTQAALYSDCLDRFGPRAGEQNTVTTWINGRTRRRSASISCVVNNRSRGAAENVHRNFFRKRTAVW